MAQLSFLISEFSPSSLISGSHGKRTHMPPQVLLREAHLKGWFFGIPRAVFFSERATWWHRFSFPMSLPFCGVLLLCLIADETPLLPLSLLVSPEKRTTAHLLALIPCIRILFFPPS